ncbi:MAG: cobalamin biosynthesis protein CobW [Alphaproteobacteria bacterium]
MTLSGKIPATVVTGFLGAGKTTLIRHLIETARGRRLALVINEFGEVGVDAGLLAACGLPGCAEEDIVELTNGCLCCTVADEFLPTMLRLIERPDPPEHIVIETSGLTLPKPLVKAFAWPEVATRVTVDGVIAVIDAAAVADGGVVADAAALAAQRAADPALGHDDPIEEVFVDQIACADLIVLNKADLLDADGLERAGRRVAAASPRPVRSLAAAHGRIDAAVLLGLEARAESDLDRRPSCHDAVGLAHEHDDFESFSFAFAPAATTEALHARLKPVLAAHPILRLKGFAAIEGSDARHVVQAVGARLQGHFDRPWRAGEERRCRLVVIGPKGLDRAAIERAIMG